MVGNWKEILTHLLFAERKNDVLELDYRGGFRLATPLDSEGARLQRNSMGRVVQWRIEKRLHERTVISENVYHLSAESTVR